MPYHIFLTVAILATLHRMCAIWQHILRVFGQQTDQLFAVFAFQEVAFLRAFADEVFFLL